MNKIKLFNKEGISYIALPINIKLKEEDIIVSIPNEEEICSAIKEKLLSPNFASLVV